MRRVPSIDLAGFFELSPDLLCVADFSGFFVAVNPSWPRVMGWSEDEIGSKPFIEFVHPEDREATIAEAASLAEGEQTLRFENRYLTKEGSYKWLTWTARADVPNQIIYCSARDVTSQKEAEAAQRQLAAIVTSSEEAIIGKTLGDVITSWNGSAERLFGYAEEEAIGRPISMIVPASRSDDLVATMKHILAAEQVSSYETQRLRKDGSLVDVSLSVSPVQDGSGHVVGAAVIARDISEELRRRRELLRSNSELEQFAFVASHDLQEPLRMIGSYVQLLERRYSDVLDDDAREFIGYAVDGAQRMQALIDDLLMFSRIGTKGKELAPIAAGEAFDQALLNLRIAIEETGARVSCDRLPIVRADVAQLTQLFQNLLANSIKYRGDGAPRISVTVVDGEDEWLFSVSDNGIGIEPRFSERIFEVFQRLHTQVEYPGTGMGLAICKKIVERHGGRIWLDTSAVEGTTLIFTLPRLSPKEEP